MQTSNINNVIFLKNVESNIIDEAFVILKDNIKINLKENIENKDGLKEKNILKEAEILINQRIDKDNLKFEKFKIKKLEKRIKLLKLINIIFVILIVITIIFK